MTVRAPLRCSQKRIDYFLTANDAWINKRLDYYADNPGLPEATFLSGSKLWLLGKPYLIKAQSGRKQDICLTDISIEFTKRDYIEGDEIKALERWYRNWAEAYFVKRAEKLHAEASISLPSFECKVRKMKRQWGNCSRKGEIKLSLALIQYPPECIDYVIYHEMSHLLHFNHSAAFYNVLEQLCPDWQSAKQKLETFSP